MARSSIIAPLYFASILALLSAERIQASNRLNAKLYQERRASKIEEWFRKLPSIENDVNGLFEDASFFSSFGPSTHEDKKSEEEIQALFRRILSSDESGRNLSASFGARTRSVGVPLTGAMSVVPGLSDEEQSELADEYAGKKKSSKIGKSSEPSSDSGTKSTKAAKYGKEPSSDSGKKSTKAAKYGKKETKSIKKNKRYKDESTKDLNRLQKSGKSVKNFSYDPHDGSDDKYAVAEEFDFDSWEWEFVNEESEDQVVETEGSPEGIMGRMEWDADEGEYTFSNFQIMGFEPVGSGDSVNIGSVGNTGTIDVGPVTTGGVGMDIFKSVENDGTMNFGPVANSGVRDFGGPTVSGEAMAEPVKPITLMSNKLGQFAFNFPTIQHTVFSGAINLKAYSSTDLSSMDPEIFDVVQSILTPYLQQTMGDSLIAYNLEIDYAPGHGKSVGNHNVVTLMEVKCTYKVISDSIDSFLTTNHAAAKQWIIDFFTGPANYNAKKLIEALQSNDIPVDDIVFVTEKFDMGNTVAQAVASFGSSPSSKGKSDPLPSGTAMVCITLSVLFAGILLFTHYTGRLPSKKEIGDFSRDTFVSMKHHSINARDSIKERMPKSIQLGKKRRAGDNKEGKGRRRRTFSGTFRRFPTGGLQKAKIQKKPAKSQEYLGDSESTSAKLSQFEEYSFSRYGKDYAPSNASQKSSIPPMTPLSRQSADEFSMAAGYDSVHNRSENDSIMERVGKTASYLMSPKRQNVKSPIPSRAPRRVTASDIASLDDVDNWSIESYETDVKSPSDRQIYRGWNESGTEMRRPVPRDPPPSSRKEKLSLPYFS